MKVLGFLIFRNGNIEMVPKGGIISLYYTLFFHSFIDLRLLLGYIKFEENIIKEDVTRFSKYHFIVL